MEPGPFRRALGRAREQQTGPWRILGIARPAAELLPELVALDDWGYPIVTAGGVPDAYSPRAPCRRGLSGAGAELAESRRSAPPASAPPPGSHGNRAPTVRR